MGVREQTCGFKEKRQSCTYAYYTHKHHKHTHSGAHMRTHGAYISKLTVRVLALRGCAWSLSVICARLIAVSWDFSFSCSSLCGKKRSDIYQASASKAKRASARINDPLNEAGNDISSQRVHIWSLAHNFKLSTRTVTTSSFTKLRLCHRHPSSCQRLPECGNRRHGPHLFCTRAIFECDSSNCVLWGRPCTANVILIRLPREGDGRRHVIVPLHILSAPLLFSHSAVRL